jgi:cell volume regulation protein A
MAPKGLAAVVLASIPLQEGIAGGDTIKNITYGIIIFSIIITSVLVVIQGRKKKPEIQAGVEAEPTDKNVNENK